MKKKKTRGTPGGLENRTGQHPESVVAGHTRRLEYQQVLFGL
jgi:hypothetical protein